MSLLSSALCMRLLETIRFLLRLEGSAKALVICICVCQRRSECEMEKCVLGQVREVICRLLSSSGTNIHKVCLSRAMEIYIIISFLMRFSSSN